MRNLFWGLVLVTLGVLFLLDNLGVADFGQLVHDYWPLILILWGISILTKKRSNVQEPPLAGAVGQGTIASELSQDLVHQSNVFGDLFASILSQNFKGGSISTVFGDCDIDLSKAVFAEGEHILRIHSVFGDSTIILPKDAAVALETSTVFGQIVAMGQRKDGFSPDLKSSSTDYGTAPRRLRIVASKVFGDIKIS